MTSRYIDRYFRCLTVASRRRYNFCFCLKSIQIVLRIQKETNLINFYFLQTLTVDWSHLHIKHNELQAIWTTLCQRRIYTLHYMSLCTLWYLYVRETKYKRTFDERFIYLCTHSSGDILHILMYLIRMWNTWARESERYVGVVNVLVCMRRFVFRTMGKIENENMCSGRFRMEDSVTVRWRGNLNYYRLQPGVFHMWAASWR